VNQKQISCFFFKCETAQPSGYRHEQACRILLKNSQPLRKIFRKRRGEIFWLRDLLHFTRVVFNGIFLCARGCVCVCTHWLACASRARGLALRQCRF